METSGWTVHTYHTVASTQDEAISAAAAGTPDRRAYLAARQTAGRGRQNRNWQSPEGNLHFSALLRPGPIRPAPAFWSLLAGIAVHEAAAAFAPAAALRLKWPNDLLLGGAKLAGVLVDSALDAQGALDWVVIGVGANLAHAPSLADRPTTCLANAGANVTPRRMAERLIAALDAWRARDMAAIRQAWLARAHPVGTRLRVRQGMQLREGVFDGLAEDGALLLRGQGPLHTGEVDQDRERPGALPLDQAGGRASRPPSVSVPRK